MSHFLARTEAFHHVGDVYGGPVTKAWVYSFLKKIHDCRFRDVY
jgi:hypothetical protein